MNVYVYFRVCQFAPITSGPSVGTMVTQRTKKVSMFTLGNTFFDLFDFDCLMVSSLGTTDKIHLKASIYRKLSNLFEAIFLWIEYRV